jgi:hypothetical protein
VLSKIFLPRRRCAFSTIFRKIVFAYNKVDTVTWGQDWTYHIILDRYKREPLTEADYMREGVLLKDIAIDIIEDREDED